jgi:hypothetical protein
MSLTKVPSLQHLSRIWRDDPAKIARVLVGLAESPPNFSYDPLASAVRDLLVFGVPYDQVVKGISSIKRQKVRENFLEVLPLIYRHFEGVKPNYFQMVQRRLYPVGRGLMVPFDPPLIYGVEGQLVFPWLSFWRSNPLQLEKLSLFVTLVEEVLLQDPDLEGALFKILDFSCPQNSKKRTLVVIDANDIPRLSSERKKEMLDQFAEGYFLAQTELKQKGSGKASESRTDERDSDQPDLF